MRIGIKSFALCIPHNSEERLNPGHWATLCCYPDARTGAVSSKHPITNLVPPGSLLHMLIKPRTTEQSVNVLFFIKCSKHEEQALYKQELQLGRQTAKQNCACSLPTPPATLLQLVARSRNIQQEPWASTSNSSEDNPDLGILEAQNQG